MLFNMLILGSLIDESGYIFHRSETDLYIVETTLPNDKDQVRNLLAAIDIKLKHHSKTVHLIKKIAKSTNICAYLAQHVFVVL